MFQESKSVVVIYATEAALDGVPPLPLADPLQRFVKADNKTFKAEIARAEQEKETAVEPIVIDQADVTPLSPSKRKYRSNSVDSMDTNRASLGNASDTNSRAGDFDFEHFEGDEVMGASGNNNGPSDLKLPPVADSVRAAGQTPEPGPITTAPGGLSSFPSLDGQAPNGGVKALQSAPEMKERGGASPFLGARHGSASAEGKQSDSEEQDRKMDAWEPTLP